MPIKPENRSRYPADWPAISKAAKERAGWKCQHPGCSARQYEFGYWITNPAQRWLRIGGPCESYSLARQRAADEHFSRFGDEIGDYRIIVIVLTVAHLDHQPENCAPDNLAAMCQRHHLAYDQQHHLQTAYAARRARAGTAELF